MFVDAYLEGDKSTSSSQTGVLIFINKAPIHWYIKRQETFEVINFGAEFCTMKAGVEMVEALSNKLIMFGVPIYGSDKMFCDNEAIYKNNITLKSVVNNKNHSTAYHRCRDAVYANAIRVSKQVTENNLSYLLTNMMTTLSRSFLLDKLT